jgi:hypothetical protein
MKQITRFELITLTGRKIILNGVFEYSIQDDGRTLKVFRTYKEEQK